MIANHDPMNDGRNHHHPSFPVFPESTTRRSTRDESSDSYMRCNQFLMQSNSLHVLLKLVMLPVLQFLSFMAWVHFQDMKNSKKKKKSLLGMPLTINSSAKPGENKRLSFTEDFHEKTFMRTTLRDFVNFERHCQPESRRETPSQRDSRSKNRIRFVSSSSSKSVNYSGLGSRKD